MRKLLDKNYLIDLIILLTSFVLFKNKFTYTMIWCIITTIFLLISGIFRNKNSLKGPIIRISIIAIISYFIVIYLCGLFTGFFRNIFNTTFIGIIKNIYLIVLQIICEEIVRYKVSRQCQYNKVPYIVFTVILIFLNISNEYSSKVKGVEEIFIFICTVVLPVIAFQSLYSYLSFHAGYLQNIIIRILITCYVYIVPIVPSLGNYLNSVVGVTYPLIIYLASSKLIRYYNKEKETYKISSLKFIYAPIITVLLILVTLVSGLFKYQIVAIATGSMEPVIYRGDAVLFGKTNDIESIKIGDVAAYIHNGTLITHRVIGVDYDNKIFRTKGDNNNNEDDYNIKEEELIGIVKCNIKYIGYPTVWLNDLKTRKKE